MLKNVGFGYFKIGNFLTSFRLGKKNRRFLKANRSFLKQAK